MCREKEKDTFNDFFQKNEEHHEHVNLGAKVIT